jgi:hypothetical protein
VASEVLAAALEAAADDARRALESAQRKRGDMDADAVRLQRRLDELAVDRAGAWAAHAEVLEGLSESSKLYARVSRKERSAALRARLYGLFGFVGVVDSFLQTRLHIAVLAPLTAALDCVQRDAAHARAETRLVMDCKRRQRRLNSDALDEIGRCSRGIREVKSDCDAVLAAVESLSTVAMECKRLSVAVMRVAAFWRQVHASMGRFSAAEVVTLVEKTVLSGFVAGGARGRLLEETSSTDDRLANDTLAHECNQSLSPVLAAIPSETPQPSTLLTSAVGHALPRPLCTALKRKLVVYYSQWAALSDVCSECSAQVLIAQSDAAGLLDVVTPGPASATVNLITPSAYSATSTATAKKQVEALAARLREELAEISHDMAASLPDNAAHSVQPPPAVIGIYQSGSGKRRRDDESPDDDVNAT